VWERAGGAILVECYSAGRKVAERLPDGFGGGDRGSIKESLKAIRQAVARAAERNATPREWRALTAVIAAVSSYSRLVDTVPVRRASVPSIAELGNLPDNMAGAVLKGLAQKGIVIYAPTRGRGRFSLVGLPTVGQEGQYISFPTKAFSTGVFSGTKKDPSALRKQPEDGTENDPGRRSLPRSTTETARDRDEDARTGFLLCAFGACTRRRSPGSSFCDGHGKDANRLLRILPREIA
jgi:hypothetical protein